MITLLIFHEESWVIKQVWFKELLNSLKRRPVKRKSIASQLHVISLQLTDNLEENPIKSRNKGEILFTTISLENTGNPLPQAAVVCGTIYKNEKSNNESQLWLLADECFPAGLFETILSEAESQFSIKAYPFLPAEIITELDVDVHKNPNKNIEREDIEFSFSLLDEEEKGQVRIALASPRNVLIIGPPGTGKTLLARYIHYHTTETAKGPFNKANFAAIPESLVEGELRGVSSGAFTGAEPKLGLLYNSNNGTLLLDELAEASLEVQSKILDLVSERFAPIRYRRVMGATENVSNVRFIATTNVPEEKWNEKFRKDLRSRFPIRIELKELSKKAPESIDYYKKALEHFSCLYFLHVPNYIPPWDTVMIKRALKKSMFSNNLRDLRSQVFGIFDTRKTQSLPPYKPIDFDELKVNSFDKENESYATETSLEPTISNFSKYLSIYEGIGFDSTLSDLSEEAVKDFIFRMNKLTLAMAIKYARGNEALARRIYGKPNPKAFKSLVQNPERLHPNTPKRTKNMKAIE